MNTITLAMMAAPGEGHYFERIRKELGDRVKRVFILVNEDDTDTRQAAYTQWPDAITVPYKWDNNWGKARNYLYDVALHDAPTYSYILSIDPDSPLIGTIPLNLGGPYYNIMVKDTTVNAEWPACYLTMVREAKTMHWELRVHELWCCENGEPVMATETLKDCYILREGTGGSKERLLEVGVPGLLADIEDGPFPARSQFYLGQTYSAAGEYKLAIEAFTKRLTMPGWVEEEYYSMYKIAVLSYVTGNFADAELWFLRAFAFRPTRHEPYRELIRLYLERNMTDLAAHMIAYWESMPNETEDLLFPEGKQ